MGDTMGKEISYFVKKFGAATVFVFELMDELSDVEIAHMGYVNGLMLSKKGVNTPQQIILEEHDSFDMLKFILAGDVSKHENYIYRNILMGFFGKEHGYLGMSVERNVS